MARTKASVGAKVAVGKSSKARCCAAPTPSTSGASSSDKSSRGSSGGNPVCPRETPKWQRPITNFFISKENSREDVEVEDTEDVPASSSKSKRSNVIESDDDEILIEKPKNCVLDETLDLEPLNGENSHKIEEYYPTGGKGKGVGKKSKGKENRRDSKRDREDDDVASNSKRVKAD